MGIKRPLKLHVLFLTLIHGRRTKSGDKEKQSAFFESVFNLKMKSIYVNYEKRYVDFFSFTVILTINVFKMSSKFRVLFLTLIHGRMLNSGGQRKNNGIFRVCLKFKNQNYLCKLRKKGMLAIFSFAFF